MTGVARASPDERPPCVPALLCDAGRSAPCSKRGSRSRNHRFAIAAAAHFPGQRFTIALTVTNFGPAASGAAFPNPALPLTEVFTTIRVGDDFRFPIGLSLSEPTACLFEEVPLDPGPGQREGVINVYDFPPLAPGQSMTCTAQGFVGLNAARVDLPITWRVVSAGDVDPNAANDTATVALGLSPRAHPVPIEDGRVLALLAIAIVLSTRSHRGPTQ